MGEFGLCYWNKVIKIASVYTAIILGAGFASGQELLHFFVRFDIQGIWGIFVSGFIFAFVGYALLYICSIKRIKNHGELLNLLFGKKFSKFIEFTVAFFLFILFATMLAASGATLKQAFDFDFSIGVIIVGFLCFISFLFGIDGIVKINTLLAPIMVIGGICVGLYSFLAPTQAVFAGFNSHWLISAIVYASYNIVTAVTVLCDMGSFISSKKVALLGGLLGGLAMTFLALCIFLPLLINYTSVAFSDIPLLQILDNQSDLFYFLYLAILICAIFTTAVANGYGFINWLQKHVALKPTTLKIIVVLGACVTSYAGFSNFVSKVYPVFGIIGLIQIIMIIFTYFRLKL